IVVAPLFIVAPVIAGLSVHWLTQMTLPGGGNGTPGWYLHILAGPLSLVLALGWRRALVFRVLGIYAVAFHTACWALQLSIFSGCTAKSADNEHLLVGDCLVSFERLSVLGWPVLGCVVLALAIATLGVAVQETRRAATPS